MVVIEKQGINSDHMLEMNVKEIANIQKFCVVTRRGNYGWLGKKERKKNSSEYTDVSYSFYV